MWYDTKGLRLDPEAKLGICFDILAHQVAANLAVFRSGNGFGAAVFSVIRIHPGLEVLTERAMVTLVAFAFHVVYARALRWLYPKSCSQAPKQA